MFKKMLIFGLSVGLLTFVSGVSAERSSSPEKTKAQKQHKQMQGEHQKQMQKRGAKGDFEKKFMLLDKLEKAYKKGDMKKVGDIIERMKHKAESFRQRLNSLKRYDRVKARKESPSYQWGGKFDKRVGYEKYPYTQPRRDFRRQYRHRQQDFNRGYQTCPRKDFRRGRRDIDRDQRFYRDGRIGIRKFGYFDNNPQGSNRRNYRRQQRQGEGFPWGW
jgi:hypothetical protein